MPTPQRTVGGLSGALRLILAVDASIVGAGYLLGPPAWSSSGTLAVVRDLGVPIPWWGSAFLLVGTLIMVVPRAGFAAGVFVYGFWGVCQIATVPDGELQAWGNPWHTLALAGLHGVGLWRNSTTRAASR